MIDRQDRPLLGELLVKRGRLGRTQLEIALEAQQGGAERLGETLVRLGLVTRGQVAGALAEQRLRWCAALFGAAMAALTHGAGMARNATSQMRVSVEVANSSTVAVAAATVAVGQGGAAAAPLALHCTEPSSVQVALLHAHYEPGGAAAQSSPYIATAPGRLAPAEAMSQQTVACAASAPVQVSVPGETRANPDEPLELQIAY